jgi:hypothetical protein
MSRPFHLPTNDVHPLRDPGPRPRVRDQVLSLAASRCLVGWSAEQEDRPAKPAARGTLARFFPPPLARKQRRRPPSAWIKG